MIRRATGLWTIAAVVSILALTVSSARAEDVSVREFRRLVTEATTDTRSLAELREVTSVEGRPVRMDSLLDGSSEDLVRRLEALGAAAIVAAPNPGAARSTAGKILAEDRFGVDDHPRPFTGLLERLSDLFARPLDWIGDRFHALPRWGQASALAAAVAVLLSAGWGLARLIVRRRPRSSDAQRHESVERKLPVPAELELAADAAEGQRDYALAVRLRFRAGLARLAQNGAIDLRTSDTSFSLRRKLSSPIFDMLVDRFDAIVYGRADATPHDAENARVKWRALHRELRS